MNSLSGIYSAPLLGMAYLA